jgi:heat shock protein HslJ
LIHRLRLIAFVAASAALLGCGDSSTAPSTIERLEGSWSLLAFENSDGTVEPIADTSRYTAQFTNEGRVGLRADCNVCGGPFSTSGVTMTVGDMACTLAACPEGSQSNDYIRAISQASSYLRHETQLFVYHPGGRLRFEQR